MFFVINIIPTVIYDPKNNEGYKCEIKSMLGNEKDKKQPYDKGRRHEYPIFFVSKMFQVLPLPLLPFFFLITKISLINAPIAAETKMMVISPMIFKNTTGAKIT